MLVGLPALFAVWLVYQYGVDVPFWDEWTIANLLLQIDDGTLTFGALVAQHNEHRMFVPRSIQLLAALIGGWDTRAGMWLTQGLLVGMLGGCIVHWRRSAVSGSRSWRALSLVLVSLILFSPAQYQNLFWGFQLCFYLPAACLLAGTIAASSPTLRLGTALAISGTLSAVAMFSILPGLLTWPLAAASMMLARGLPRRDTALEWCGWAVGCASVFGLYFLGFVAPDGTPPTSTALGNPLMLLAGVATCMGGALAIGSEPVKVAMATGAAIVISFLWLLAVLFRRRSDASLVTAAAPWIVMGGFGLLTAIAIAVGRIGYGDVAMLESRYTALTGWTPISIVMITAALRDRLGTVSAIRAWRAVVVSTLALSVVGFPHYLSSVRRDYNERLQSLAIYTFAEAAPGAVPMLPPWLDWPAFRKKLIHVEQAGWRKARLSSPTWVDDGKERSGCEFGAVEFEDAVKPRVMAGGWAYLPAFHRPADAVLVTSGPSRRVTVVQPPLIGRRDIGDRFSSDAALVTGWTLESRAAPPGETLEFWALDATSLRAYLLCRANGHPRATSIELGESRP